MKHKNRFFVPLSSKYLPAFLRKTEEKMEIYLTTADSSSAYIEDMIAIPVDRTS